MEINQLEKSSNTNSKNQSQPNQSLQKNIEIMLFYFYGARHFPTFDSNIFMCFFKFNICFDAV